MSTCCSIRLPPHEQPAVFPSWTHSAAYFTACPLCCESELVPASSSFHLLLL